MKIKACVALTLCLISKLKLKTPLTVFNVCIILLERANSSQQWSNNPSLERFIENVGDLPHKIILKLNDVIIHVQIFQHDKMPWYMYISK